MFNMNLNKIGEPNLKLFIYSNFAFKTHQEAYMCRLLYLSLKLSITKYKKLKPNTQKIVNYSQIFLKAACLSCHNLFTVVDYTKS